jgi:hypothetical protein
VSLRVCARCGVPISNDPRARFCSKSCARRARVVTPGFRFWTKVDKTAGCWLWTGSLNHGGYGHTSRIGGSTLAHRVAWYLTHGPVPDGLTLDHLCRNPRCVNPAHLEPVPLAINRARVIPAVKDPISHCKAGHPFDEANTRTYLRNGRARRACRECNRVAVARYRG